MPPHFVIMSPPTSPRQARVTSTTALKMSAADDLIGASVETSGVWDPAGFAKDEASLYKYRQV
jgi:hypothetical protein